MVAYPAVPIAASIIAPMNVLVCSVLFMMSSFHWDYTGYCSSSPASENAELALLTDEPQTTLVAEAVPVLDPQTTLNALVELSLQGRLVPQTTDDPHTTELPQTTEVPQTTD